MRLEGDDAYRVGFIAGARKGHHAVETCEYAIALVAVAVELLLGEDIPTALGGERQLDASSGEEGPNGAVAVKARRTRGAKRVNSEASTYLAREANHGCG